jgi:AcrR family transcriptional regulator
MPRGFTPTQMQAIRQKLQTCALKKIQETGVRKTSVESLAHAVNISTGAFYKFYPSKEALFFEVYELLESRLKDEFITLIEPLHECDPACLKQALLTLFASENMNHLITIIRKDELDALVAQMDAEILRQHQQTDQIYIAEILNRLHARGLNLQIDVDLVLSYLQALFILNYQKDGLAPHAGHILDTFLTAMLNDLLGAATS